VSVTVRAGHRAADETLRHPAGGGKSPKGFRPDIQGLRALAVSMVVVYHLYPSVLPGGFAGVDVFFVISGFLITGHMWREYQKTGTIALADFWGRRAKRLMPASALVLAVTWAVSYLVLPTTQLATVASQIRASALYFQNWELAHEAVNYLDQGAPPTPVQHFWSLSVEEQFYLVWPLLFVISALVFRSARRKQRAGASQAGRLADRDDTPVPHPGWQDYGADGWEYRDLGDSPEGHAGTGSWQAGQVKPEAGQGVAVPARVRGHLLIGLLTSALVLASIAYSSYETKANPSSAYFVTTTRLWELGCGGLLALLPASLASRIGKHGWLGWTGLALALGSLFVLRATTPFPGLYALIPVGGAVLLIACGSPEASYGPGRLMSLGPLVWIGGISYSLYLWHFPIFTLWAAWRGHPIGSLDGPLLVLAAVLLSWATKVLVEDKVRQAKFLEGRQWRSLGTVLAAAVPVALVTAFLVTQPGTWTGKLGPNYPGGAVLAGTKAAPPVGTVLPPLSETNLSMAPQYWQDGCLVAELSPTPKSCVYGDTKDPKLTVALVGDSIAGNWFPALDAIAKQEHWKLVTELHGDCGWTATLEWSTTTNSPYTACKTWGAAVMQDLLTKIHPNVVITSGRKAPRTPDHPNGAYTRQALAGARQGWAEVGAGEASYWQELQAHGISVVAIKEGPEVPIAVHDCVVSHASDYMTACSAPAANAVPRDTPETYAAAKLGGKKVPIVDMNSLICGPATCAPVVGNVLVFFDQHHLTAAYAETLAPFLLKKLLAVSPALKDAAPV
jgi:peptidoglycan/LPS O-acetylase OafA/YrhL